MSWKYDLQTGLEVRDGGTERAGELPKDTQGFLGKLNGKLRTLHSRGVSKVSANVPVGL